MQPATNDRSQQPRSSGFANASNLVPNQNIWMPQAFESSNNVSSLSTATADPANNATSSTDSPGWFDYSWNGENSRSTSTSPHRTRDNALTRSSTYGATAAAAAAVVAAAADTPYPSSFGNNAIYPDGPAQRRPSAEAGFYDPAGQFSRDTSAPPSRQSSQASSSFTDIYGGRSNGHNQSSSFQRATPAANTTVSMSHQAANSRAFGMNGKVDDELSMSYNRRAPADHAHGSQGSQALPAQSLPNQGLSNQSFPNQSLPNQGLSNQSFQNQSFQNQSFPNQSLPNQGLPTQGLPTQGLPTQGHAAPAAQPFQLNPGSQPFGDSSAYDVGTDPQVDVLSSQLARMQRPSAMEPRPGHSYRLDRTNSPRNYTPAASETLNAPSSSRDPRTADVERRGSALDFGATAHDFYPQQMSYAGIQPQAAGAYVEAYGQGYRPPAVPGYTVPYPGNYQMGGMPPIQPAADHDPTRGMRSQVLEEYKNNKSKKWDLKDFYNYMVEFSGDQHGSRFIQLKLETANSDEKDQVFREIEPNAIQLMKDVFGNYVVQKFFEHGNQAQKKMLAEKIKSKMTDLSLQVYACRVVQKALEHVLVDQQLEMVRQLENDTLRVITDPNGNHVIQKIIGLLDRKHLEFIMRALRGQVVMLSNHQYGCRVVQRMMDHGTDEDRSMIVAELRPSAHMLLPDQYGNYVAQHIIVHGKFEDRLRMVSLVLDQLVDLCKHKFASNVVETCIINGVPELRTMIRQRFEQVGSDGNSVLQQLIRDSYGNYVIQKMAMFLTGAEQDAFVEQLKPLFHGLKKNGNSRQISAMERMFEQHANRELRPDANTYPNASPVAPAPGITVETEALEAKRRRLPNSLA